MKKVAVLLLAVVMLVGLCACSTVTEADFVGYWVCKEGDDLRDAFYLSSSGFAYVGYVPKGSDEVWYGQWEYEADSIFIRYRGYSSDDYAHVFQVLDKDTLVFEQWEYHRQPE